MDSSVPDGSSIFLGDSITHGLAVAAVAPNAINFGIGQQTTGQLLASLPGFKSLPRANRIYLNIGTNDNLGEPSVLFPKLRAVLDALPSNVPVTWSGLMPRSGLSKLTITANTEIKKICAMRPGCTYADSFGAMSDSNGEPLQGIYLDGAHPSAKGYKLWIKAMTSANHFSNPAPISSPQTP